MKHLQSRGDEPLIAVLDENRSLPLELLARDEAGIAFDAGYLIFARDHGLIPRAGKTGRSSTKGRNERMVDQIKRNAVIPVLTQGEEEGLNVAGQPEKKSPDSFYF